MNISEQTFGDKKKIEAYKNAGYTELKFGAWKAKRTSDQNGDFVNVGTYYYGYKASAPKQDKKDKEVTKPDTTTKPDDTTKPESETKPSAEAVITQPKKQKPVVDCTDVWPDNENPFIRYAPEGEEDIYAEMFLDWVMTQTPGLLQSGGPYLGQCGLIYSAKPYVNTEKYDLHTNATLKRIAERKMSVDNTYMTRAEFWFNKVNNRKTKNNVKTDDIPNKVNTPIGDTKVDVPNVSSTSKVKDSRLERFYDSVDSYTVASGVNTNTNANEMTMSRSTCDTILSKYIDFHDLFGDSFEKTGYDRKEFAQNQTKVKRFLYYCYSKFPKKYSEDSNFKRAQGFIGDWGIDVSSVNRNDVKESSLMESVTKKLKNKKEMKNLTESVRNKLITVKTKKRIQEESLKIKLSILSEELKNKNYQMMFEKISSEFNNTGKKVLTEEETMSLENGIKRLFSGKESKLKEKVVSHILSKLKLTEGSEVYNKVKTELESTSDSDMLRLITDCNYTAGKIVNSLPDTLMSQMKNGSETESLSGIVRNAMASAIADKSMVDDIKYKVAQLICPSLKDLESNINKESESLISKYLNSED